MLAAGVRILQLREKVNFGRAELEIADHLASACAKADALFVINDRADIAAMTGAALHLGQDDLLPADARKVVASETCIGYSTHNEKQLRAAAYEPADYLALGPIFSTSSKLNPDPEVGLEELRRLRPLTDRPLVAIGGITEDNARAVRAAGADSVAVIGALYPSGSTPASVGDTCEQWLRLTE